MKSYGTLQLGSLTIKKVTEIIDRLKKESSENKVLQG